MNQNNLIILILIYIIIALCYINWNNKKQTILDVLITSIGIVLVISSICRLLLLKE